MMQRIHGSVAKLVNDLLPERRTPFWGDPGHQDYFDGCIRDEKQCRLAYRYTLTQSVRHGLCRDWREYRHTRVNVDLEGCAPGFGTARISGRGSLQAVSEAIGLRMDSWSLGR